MKKKRRAYGSLKHWWINYNRLFYRVETDLNDVIVWLPKSAPQEFMGQPLKNLVEWAGTMSHFSYGRVNDSWRDDAPLS